MSLTPEPVGAPTISAGISVTEPLSPAWEVDEGHLSADPGGLPAPEDPYLSSLITEIDDIIGPEESTNAHRERWYTPDLRQRFAEWKRRRFF